MEFPEFLSRFTDCKVSLNEKLSNYGGYKTGGRAKFFIVPKSVKSLSETINFCEENGIKSVIIGNATNVLFSDKGFDGAVISTLGIKGLKTDGETLTAFCGESLIGACEFAKTNAISGMENFSGIPASVGGAAVMNAGAFGKNLSDITESVSALKDGKIIKYAKNECGFSYRKSRFSRGGEIVVSVTFALKKGDKTEIKKLTEKFSEKRKVSQPSDRSCGSVFRNPSDGFAAKLIEDARLKGFKIGGAFVSPVHANFIIAEKGATSSDVYNLIQTVKEKIKDKYGILLKEEIKYIGDFT